MQLLQINRNTVFKALATDSTQLPNNQKVIIPAGASYPLSSYKLEGNHYLVQLQQDLFPVGKTGYFYADHVTINNPLKNRGVWMTNVDSDVLDSRENIKVAVQRLAQMGFNIIYPVVWNKGYTLYPSPIAKQASGFEVDPKFQGRDMLAELIEEAKPYGFRIIPWFEYGLKALPNSAIAQRNPNWLTKTVTNQTIPDSQDPKVWFNPAHPEVIQFMTGMIAEVVRNYDVQGIQLDDHFSLHASLGYDAYTRSLYRREKGVEPPSDASNSGWMQWRADQLTGLMEKIFKAVKQVKPGCWVSLSPNRADWAYKYYLTDWIKWERRGLVEEIVIQMYTTESEGVQGLIKELSTPHMIAARNHIPVSIGILSGLKNHPKDPSKPVGSGNPIVLNKAVSLNYIRQQLEIVRKSGYAGVSFFFYETVINQLLTSEAKQPGDRDPALFKSLLT